MIRKAKVVRKSDIARQYATHQTIADLLPWLEFSDDQNMMLLEDGRSVGAAFDLLAVPTEARPESHIATLHRKLTELLSKLLPLEDENPWIMQFFVQDDLTLKPVYDMLAKRINENGLKDDRLSRHYLKIMREHFELMCAEEGILTDPLSGLPFRGKIRRIRVCIYRRYETIKNRQHTDTVEELTHVCEKFVVQLRQIGIKVKRMDGANLYDWLVRWFNPRPLSTNGDIDKLIEDFPYPKGRKPFGWSFTQNVLHDTVQSDQCSWIFNNIKHKLLLFREQSRQLDIGVISREMNLGESQKYALLDKLPAGSIYTLQVTFESKMQLENHLDKIEGAAVGKSGVIADIHNEIKQARYEIDNGNLLFRVVEGIYLRGANDHELKSHELGIQALLQTVGIEVTATLAEVFPLDGYLRLLPFSLSYEFDKKKFFRSAYKYADDVARLLPLYGRSRGDGQNPLMIFYNRGGEVFMFDHLSPTFKQSNSHMAIIGTTGAGKSVTLNNMILAMSAVQNPRIIAIEVGGSFALTAQYLAAHGRKVETMYFDRANPISVNPCAESDQALKIIEAEEAMLAKRLSKQAKGKVKKIGITEEVIDSHLSKVEKEIGSQNTRASEAELACDEDRDILNEMLIATLVMITQGKEKEEAKLDPIDYALITHALIAAMKSTKARDVSQMELHHVVATLKAMADREKDTALASRLRSFALRLEYYTKGVRGQFVNQPSQPLQDFDFLHVDFGFMQSASYKDLMNIVCISLLSKILAMAEANKASGRPTILLLDEAHVLFKSEMVATFITLMSKVARKIGLWIHPCTQNINDFTGVESKKVLSMMETWLCLSLEADEVALIEKFKPLSKEIRALILDVKKFPRVYSEGVLMGKNYQGLFRNIPPRIALSLAMTEQDERSRRKQIQNKHGLTELEAVEQMAKEIKVKTKVGDDAHFAY